MSNNEELLNGLCNAFKLYISTVKNVCDDIDYTDSCGASDVVQALLGQHDDVLRIAGYLENIVLAQTTSADEKRSLEKSFKYILGTR